MAVSLAASEIADLCIGRSPVAALPAFAAVADAFAELRRSPRVLAVADSGTAALRKGSVSEVVGCVSAADLLCFLAGSDATLADPSAALARPLCDVIVRDCGVRRIEPRARVSEAVDAILDGARVLAVPVRCGGNRRKLLAGHGAADYCLVTQHDLVRFFLNSLSLFSGIASCSISYLDIIRSEFPSVHHGEPALSAIPHIRHAIASGTSVAVVTDDGQIVGEICPDMLASCDEAAIAAMATLSVNDLMSYIDHSGAPPEYISAAIKSGLKKEKLFTLLELMEDDFKSTSSVSNSNSSASSSDDESGHVGHRRLPRLGSCGRRSTEELVACNPGSSLAAVMLQAVANQVNYVWVIDDDDDGRLIGIVAFADVLRVIREQL